MRALLVVILALSTSLAFGAEKNKPNKKAKETFKFMTFEQVANLEHTQRLKYVTALRQSATEIEKMQYMFRDSVKDASLEKVKEYNRLYAMIMGEAAEAQAEPVGDTGLRGRSPADKCIFGYNLSKYPSSGVRQPFECEIPADRECAGGGVRCGDFLSGLGAGLADNCISRASRHVATQACDAIRADLSKENKFGPEIREAVANADKFFGFHEQNSTLTKEDMTGEEAKKILADLAKHAYDDRAYAQLIYVLGLYKKSGIRVNEIVGLGDVYSKLMDASLFEKDFNDIQTAINQIFGDYLAHCNSPVPDSEIDTLTSSSWSSKYDGFNSKGDKVGSLEKERIEAARAFKAGSGKRKVEDITEIRECRAIRARVNNIAQIINRTRGSYPNPNGPDPGPVTPDPLPIAEPNPKPTGCTTNVTSEEHQLYQSASRCMICMTDRAVAQSVSANDSNEKAKAKENYATSTKWMSLVSSMALACGDGANGRYLTVDVLDRYRQMFGHCSDKTYRWKDAEPLTADDKTLIEDWSNAEMWSGKKKWRKNPADADDDFKRIYGIKYETATKMFCNMKRFKKGIFTGKIRTLNEKFEAGDPAESVNARRAQFLSYLDGDKKNGEAVVSPDTKADSVADDLLSCMKESAETAKTLYSEAGQGVSCTMSKKMDGNHDAEFGAMVNGIKGGGGAIIFNSGSCYVAKHIEKDQKGDRENIGFSFPSDVVHKSNVLKLAYENNGANKLPKIVSSPSQKQKNRNLLCPTGQTNTDDCEDLNTMSFLYPNPGICSVASSKTLGKPKGISR